MEEPIWQYHLWRPHFSGCMFKCVTLVLPSEVLDYLAEDSLMSPTEIPELSAFMSQLQLKITEVGGQGVVPKLNWKVPQDATWMLQFPCKSAEQVLMILKASDITRDELQLLKDMTIEPVLNLIRFHKLKDGMEFRGFVYNRALVGLCQRNHGATEVKELALTKVKEIFSTKLREFPPISCTD
mmetsp:Transcript_24956/g.43823  ORF Transcript_24956/g.43823 Transcript_24956/m.43823 type:complete len:183 (-) Transcript_24956:953-1501(-)